MDHSALFFRKRALCKFNYSRYIFPRNIVSQLSTFFSTLFSDRYFAPEISYTRSPFLRVMKFHSKQLTPVHEKYNLTERNEWPCSKSIHFQVYFELCIAKVSWRFYLVSAHALYTDYKSQKSLFQTPLPDCEESVDGGKNQRDNANVMLNMLLISGVITTKIFITKQRSAKVKLSFLANFFFFQQKYMWIQKIVNIRHFI